MILGQTLLDITLSGIRPQCLIHKAEYVQAMLVEDKSSMLFITEWHKAKWSRAAARYKPFRDQRKEDKWIQS